MLAASLAAPKAKAASFHWRLLANCYLPGLVAMQQHAFGLLRVLANLAIEQPVAFEIDLDEGRTGGDYPLDQRLGQRVFDVPLQSAAQRTCTVVSVRQSRVQDPFLGLFGHGDGDVALGQVAI